MFGFRVKIRFVSGVPQQVWVRNVTEIHWNYREGHVAFESDVHNTGATFNTQDIAEFEATLETDVAREF